jgi:hypothetical protein
MALALLGTTRVLGYLQPKIPTVLPNLLPSLLSYNLMELEMATRGRLMFAI